MMRKLHITYTPRIKYPRTEAELVLELADLHELRGVMRNTRWAIPLCGFESVLCLTLEAVEIRRELRELQEEAVMGDAFLKEQALEAHADAHYGSYGGWGEP